MEFTVCRQKMPYLMDNAMARDTTFHREASVTSQPVLGANAVGVSFFCRLEPWRYGFASTTSTQSYIATIGASTVQLLAEDAALRQTDTFDAFAITAIAELPLEGVVAKSDRRRLGRVDDVSPTLIPLLRSNAEARHIFEDNFENDLGPAIGVITSVILSVLIWGVITVVAWCFLWR